MCDFTTANARLTHSAVVYDDDHQLLEVAVPFLREGVASGEPTLLSMRSPQRDLILQRLDDVSGVTQLPPWPSNAAFSTLRHNHRLFTERGGGARHVRILGEVPYVNGPASWGGWVRYEAAVNHIYADMAVSMLCPYDRRLARPEVLADIEHTHPILVPDGHGPNQRFIDPATFLAGIADRDLDPVEAEPPALELVNQRPRVSRRAVAALGAAAHLDGSTIDSLALAVGEVVTNALLRGRPPVIVRAWSTHDRVVVTVEDHGEGPSDPFIGMVPAAPSPAGGLGLNIVYQVCTLVTMTRQAGRFTVHLTMRRPSTQE